MNVDPTNHKPTESRGWPLPNLLQAASTLFLGVIALCLLVVVTEIWSLEHRFETFRQELADDAQRKAIAIRAEAVSASARAVEDRAKFDAHVAEMLAKDQAGSGWAPIGR